MGYSLAAVRWPQIMRRTALGIGGVFLFLLLYGLIASFVFQRSFPDPARTAARYLQDLQTEDWPALARMHASRADGDAAVRQWQHLRAGMGPVGSYAPNAAYLIPVPLHSRAQLVYEIRYARGPINVAFSLVPRWGRWEIDRAHPFFRSPAPFVAMPGQRSRLRSGTGPPSPSGVHP